MKKERVERYHKLARTLVEVLEERGDEIPPELQSYYASLALWADSRKADPEEEE